MYNEFDIILKINGLKTKNKTNKKYNVQSHYKRVYKMCHQ